MGWGDSGQEHNRRQPVGGGAEAAGGMEAKLAVAVINKRSAADNG